MVRFIKSIVFHLAPAIVVVLAIAALAGPINLYMLTGIAIGSLLLDIDHWLFIFVGSPNEPVSKEIRYRLASGSYTTALDYMVAHRRDFRRLPLHSVGFQLALAVAALYAIVQTPNTLTAGLMLGLFLHSVVDQAGDLNRTGHLHHWFWITGRQAYTSTQKMYFVLALIVLSLLLAISLSQGVS